MCCQLWGDDRVYCRQVDAVVACTEREKVLSKGPRLTKSTDYRQFVFCFSFHEKYTKNPTLLLIKVWVTVTCTAGRYHTRYSLHFFVTAPLFTAASILGNLVDVSRFASAATTRRIQDTQRKKTSCPFWLNRFFFWRFQFIFNGFICLRHLWGEKKRSLIVEPRHYQLPGTK